MTFREKLRAMLHVAGEPSPLLVKRGWFRADDGTYYRNCPLIMGEQRDALRRGDSRLARELGAEWDTVFAAGIVRKSELGSGDVVKQTASFREAYPDKPGLWVLDEPEAS